MTSEIPSQNKPSAKSKSRSTNYSVQEDILLVSAWLNIGLDPVKGNDQKSTAYWARIAEYYHKNKTFETNRDASSLQHRWSAIQAAVNKFCGYYEQILNRPQSGETEQDKLQRAKKMYREREKVAFLQEHNWNILKYEQKWISFSAKKAAIATTRKRKSVNPEASLQNASSPIVLDEGNGATSEPSFMERPIGQKQAKDLLKKEKVKENVASQLEQFRAFKRETERRKEERFQLSLSQEEKLYILKEKKEQAKQQREDDKIMLIDITTLPEMQAAYFRDRQAEIMARRARPSESM
ncbi:glutathione S-transferase T3-like [Rosa rugosa]|uniref:glutathione S-transferase T3-like n=1 Tax=Rosa rugosa TaxID=74645 RepID=UPI002B405C5A|nr:glutathione S-transferase T3-like [Rosa rugosa]